MVDRLDYKIVGLAILVLLCWMGFSPLACSSTMVWSDDFNDGNYDGWTICNNSVISTSTNWSAANDNLQLNEDAWSNTWGISWGAISYPSSIAHGTWSFDIKVNESLFESGGFVSIVFISNNISNLVSVNDWNCYWIYFDIDTLPASDGENFTIYLRRNEHTVLHSSEPVPVAGWHHMNVTRDEAGLFTVFHNDALLFQVLDTEIDTSEMFAFCGPKGIVIDNIVVDDEFEDYTPTTGPTTGGGGVPDWWLLVIAGVSVVVIVAVLVIFQKRR
ncbi:MAG: hypothetical protein ACFFDD_14640 [Promethearchaeota archaeon]